jgi:hypothetical protein
MVLYICMINSEIIAIISLDKIQHSFLFKNSQQSINRKKLPQHDEDHIWHAHSQHHVQCWKVESFPFNQEQGRGACSHHFYLT